MDSCGRTDMRRIINPLVLAALGSVCLIGSASAAEMTGAEIKEFVTDKTIYLDLNTAGSIVGTTGQSVLYFAADGTALNKTPKGETWHGTWVIKENTSCVDWKERPNNPCTKYDKSGDTVTFINVANGQPRGTVAKTAAGNAEKIGP
jgi:hypothetical protein